MKKYIIAHELGHALSSCLQDKYNDISNICFDSSEEDFECYAYCELGEPIENKPTFRRLKSISDLGGMFGELMMFGEFKLWWCRGDFDSFALLNVYSKSKIVDEVDHLLYKCDGVVELMEMSRLERKKNFHKYSINIVELKNNYPNIYAAYRNFEKKIFKCNFRQAVEYHFCKKTVYMNNEEYKYFQDEVTR